MKPSRLLTGRLRVKITPSLRDNSVKPSPTRQQDASRQETNTQPESAPPAKETKVGGRIWRKGRAPQKPPVRINAFQKRTSSSPIHHPPSANKWAWSDAATNPPILISRSFDKNPTKRTPRRIKRDHAMTMVLSLSSVWVAEEPRPRTLALYAHPVAGGLEVKHTAKCTHNQPRRPTPTPMPTPLSRFRARFCAPLPLTQMYASERPELEGSGNK